MKCRFILDKMVRAVTDGLTGSKMPAKAESYIAFLDLCFVVGANANDSLKCGSGEEEREKEDAAVESEDEQDQPGAQFNSVVEISTDFSTEFL